MSCGALWYFSVGLRFDSMDEVREKDGILDEENRDIVTNNVYHKRSVRNHAKIISRGCPIPKLPSSV